MAINLEEPKVKDVLKLLAAGAILSLAVLAPNAPANLFRGAKPWRKYKKKRLNQAVKRLRDQELVSFKEEGTTGVVRLTDKGKDKVLRFNLEELSIDKNQEWDGGWKVVTFDIPDSRKKAREIFRRKLKELDFYPLQKSVFLTPYKCKEEIDFIKHTLEVGNYVKYFETKGIEEEDFFKGWFNLN